MLGPESNKTWEDFPLFVTLGVNKGDKFGPFNEEDYANRLVMAVATIRWAWVPISVRVAMISGTGG